AAAERRTALEAEESALNARIVEARTEADRLTAGLEAGRSELASLEQRLTVLRGEIEAATGERDALRAELAAGRQEAERLTSRQAELARAIAEDEARRDALRAEVEAAEAEAAAAVPPQPEPLPSAGPARPSDAVAAAVRAAPGLEGADEATRARLVAELENGACVVPALQAALGEVNRQTAAALIRALGTC
ncbi:MAG: smc, partial [Rhodospirillales bacterium]|nr:smc [Rhodospirillales bacterium]